MPRKSPFEIRLSEEEHTALEAIIRKYTSPYNKVIRAKIILLAAEGYSNDVIADRLEMPRQIVSKWRKRYFEEGMAGLQDRPREGRPPSFSP